MTQIQAQPPEREFWFQVRNGLNQIAAAMNARAKATNSPSLALVAKMIEAASGVIALHLNLKNAGREW